MKYLFICLDNIENRYLYSGYNEYDDSAVVFLPNKIRLMCKAITLSGLSKNVIYKYMARIFFSLHIEKKILSLGWSLEEEYCFIIYARDYESYGDSIVWFLRDKYKTSKIVCYFVDRIDRHIVELEHVNDIFDAVFTWDKAEAEKYGLEWCKEPFSTVLIDKLDRNVPMRWDVTLVAHAKDRLPSIMKLYERLRKEGFICDFHLVGVPKEERVYEDDIEYKPLSFEGILEHVMQSKCVIEVLQKNTSSPTTRFAEATLLNRMLLTNSQYFKECNEYSNVIYFEALDDIDFDRIYEHPKLDMEMCKKSFSNRQMIKTISDVLYRET